MIRVGIRSVREINCNILVVIEINCGSSIVTIVRAKGSKTIGGCVS
jgi:hypothetical protein